MGDADALAEMGRAGDLAATCAGSDRFRQSANKESPLGRQFGQKRQHIAGHCAIKIVFQQPDTVAAGNVGDRLAPLQR